MTTMRRISYEEVDRTHFYVEKKSTFIFEDIGENKTYEGVVNKFKNFRFEEEFINELKEEFECQSRSHLAFGINFKINEGFNDYYLLLSMTLDIPNRDEVEYEAFPILSDTLDEDKRVNDLFKNNTYEKVYVTASMSTKFSIQRGLDIMNQYEEEMEELFDEGYDDNETPPVTIETPFISDNCSICLSNIPNIIFFPCLHQSVCSECEEVGKLLKCSVCRKKIERKIKI